MARIDSNSRLLAIEISHMLGDLFKKYPDGISAAELAKEVKVDLHVIYPAIRALEEINEIQWIKRPDMKGRIVVPNGYKVGRFNLTERQQSALNAMIANANDQCLVSMSIKDISLACRTKSMAGAAIIYSLERKGYLQKVKEGGSKKAAVYRVFPDGDGPRIALDCETNFARQSEKNESPQARVVPIDPEECSQCRFFMSKIGINGICRRNPPTHQRGFPSTITESWCGEFRRGTGNSNG